MMISQHPIKRGKPVTTPPIQNTGGPASGQRQTLQDLMLVSSFGLWAVLLGLTPVLAFHLM
jgi:hypothetical protein